MSLRLFRRGLNIEVKPRLSHAEIDKVIAALEHLKSSSFEVDDVRSWGMNDSLIGSWEAPFPWAESDSTKYFEVIAKLQALRTVDRTLMQLTGILDDVKIETIDLTKETLVRYGMRRLPDDLLVIIFGFVCESAHEGEESVFHGILALSHTCRHFRHLAVTTKSLWAYLDVNAPPQLNQLALERCGDLPLSVISPGRIRFSSFGHPRSRELVLRESFRWKHVNLFLESWNDHHADFFHGFASKRELPALCSLELGIQARSQMLFDPSVAFLASISLPRNPYLSFDDLCPPLDFPLSLVHKYTIDVDTGYLSWRDTFIDTAAQLVQVRHLTCEISGESQYNPLTSGCYIHEAQEAINRETFLSHLTHLELQINFSFSERNADHTSTVDFVMRMLPYRTVLSLSIYYKDTMAFSKILQDRNVRWDRLDALRVVFDPWANPAKPKRPALSPFQILCAASSFSMPCLREITLIHFPIENSVFQEQVENGVRYWSKYVKSLRIKSLLILSSSDMDIKHRGFVQNLRKISPQNIRIYWSGD